jgi:uncharacterized protein
MWNFTLDEFQHTNRLVHETSPYLLQHKHNPVNWYPWGNAALEQAKAEDKPIFLSIGYSSCHWCHVMADESFECEKTAHIMNEKFINIKVDREERPDIDAVYMKSIILLVGQGGWPISLFLTPNCNPYFGGTYFPPTKKYNRPGFPQVLEEAFIIYKEQKDNLKIRTQKILEKLHTSESSSESGLISTHQLIDDAVRIMEERFDSDEGGFGSGMKFPEPMNYTMLLRHWVRTGADQSIRMLDKTLTKMAEGGMCDQLAGGFHRYSTDRHWRVPHFEKMLYDNALLSKLYIDMLQATKQDIYSDVPRDIFKYVLSEMTSPEGAFYSGQDADTDGEEGSYYFWEMKEFLELLGPRNAKLMARHFGVTSSEGTARKNILYIGESIERLAKLEGIAIFELDHILRKSKEILLKARRKRTRPFTDKKIITGWNGLMITAFAAGYMVLHGKNYLEVAIRAGEFLWNNMWTDSGVLLRIYSNAESKIKGCLEDYAYFLEAVLSLYEASFDLVWIDRANQLADKMVSEFYDIEEGGFFMSGLSSEVLIARLKNAADEAIPSANAIAILSILKLGHLTGNKHYLDIGARSVNAFKSRIDKNPAAHTGILAAADFMASSITEVVFTGALENSALEDMRDALYQDYRPNKAVVWNNNGQASELIPLSRGKSSIEGTSAAYICEQETCHSPVKSGKALSNLLKPPPEIRLNIFNYDKQIKDTEKEEQGKFLGVMDQIFKQSGLK